VDYERLLDEGRTFNDVYRLVKRVVEDRLDMRRAGLGLVLLDLPTHLAAFHEVGSNAIVLNKTLLNAVMSMAKSRREVNSYVFVVLLHEYLHTLGFDEVQARETVKQLVGSLFTENHIATKMATQSVYEVYPGLRIIPPLKPSGKPEMVRDFDSDSVTYID